MKVAWSPWIAVGFALVAGGCFAPNRLPAQMSGHDIVPDAWIGHDGGRPVFGSGDETGARIFPSPPSPERPPVDVQHVVNGVLKPASRIYLATYRCPLQPKIQIDIEPNGADLKLVVPTASIDAIRKLDWRQFRLVQTDFNRWLSRQGEPNSLKRLFHPPFEQEAYSKELRTFWLKCLESAEFAAYQREVPAIAKWPPDPGRLRATTQPSATDAGPTMGAVPLVPGMRLVIHWGGTTVYSYGLKFVITRQTTVGTSTIDVLYREGRVVLDPPRFMFATTRPAGTRDEWTMDSEPPLSDNSLDISPYLPAGQTPPPDRFFVLVYNYYDLFHVDALRKTSGNPSAPAQDPGDIAPRLTLLFPAAYVKSDFARKEGPTEMRADAKPGTSDALKKARVDDGEIWRTFARRFIVWGGARQFASPETDAPQLDQVRNRVTPWDYAPLIFGDQTAVSVELPVSIDRKPAEFVPLGTTWGDVLDARERWRVESQGSGRSDFRVVRSSFAPSNARPDDPPYRAEEFRFHDLPLSTLRDMEAGAGDVLYARDW